MRTRQKARIKEGDATAAAGSGEVDGTTPLIGENRAVMCIEGRRTTIAYYFMQQHPVSLRQNIGCASAEGCMRCLTFNTKTRQPGLVSDRAFAFAE